VEIIVTFETHSIGQILKIRLNVTSLTQQTNQFVVCCTAVIPEWLVAMQQHLQTDLLTSACASVTDMS